MDIDLFLMDMLFTEKHYQTKTRTDSSLTRHMETMAVSNTISIVLANLI